MRTNKIPGSILLTASAALLALVATGCDKPAPQVAPPPDAPAQTVPAVPDAPPPAEMPSPDAPPPTDPSAAPKPVTENEPPVESMLAAIPSAKMSVAVDLRYSFEGEVLPNQPVMVHLAAIPRVGGVTMKVSPQEAPGLQMAAGPLAVQKTTASGVYRQQFSLTKLTANTEPLRVLVTMQAGEDMGFGYFTIPIGTIPIGTIPIGTIPLDPGTNPQKLDSVKQR